MKNLSIGVLIGTIIAIIVNFMFLFPVYATDNPEIVINSMANNTLNAVKNRQGDIESIVDQYVIPYIDLESVSKLAVGKYWKSFTSDQRTRFTAVFKQLLIRTYSTPLRDYKGTAPEVRRTIVKEDKAQVDTTVVLNTPVNVSYRLRLVDGGWKIFDVSIEGISLIVSYRSTYDQFLKTNTVDALIAKLSV